jgi:DNA (cytosine-5)-methyltransferase 1
MKDMKKSWRVISLFSGCGGMDLGFRGGFRFHGKQYKRLPFEIIWANDLNAAACSAYKQNVGQEIVCGDIWKLMDQVPSSADVVIGGFPCQDISINGKMRGIEGARSGLYRAMVEVVSQSQPKIFVAENVKGLLMKHSEKSLETVIRDFASLGYNVTCTLYNAASYGVPQTRERVFIVGVRKEFTFAPPKSTNSDPNSWLTACDAICDLEEIPERGVNQHIWSRANRSPHQGDRRLKADRPAQTIRAECHGNIQWHYRLPRRISMREAARFQSFPDSYVFDSGIRETERMIGNAVPPVLAWHVARAVSDSLDR